MNYKIFLFGVLLISGILSRCSGNKNSKTDNKEEKEISSLLKYYINHELKRDSIFLYEKSPNALNKLCINDILFENKGINLRVDEILNKSQKDTITWAKDLIPIAKIIGANDIIKLRYDMDDEKREKEGKLFYLSNPVFSADFNYAILSSIFVCGSRCGEKSTLLFKKHKGSWGLVKTYCKSVN